MLQFHSSTNSRTIRAERSFSMICSRSCRSEVSRLDIPTKPLPPIHIPTVERTASVRVRTCRRTRHSLICVTSSQIKGSGEKRFISHGLRLRLPDRVFNIFLTNCMHITHTHSHTHAQTHACEHIHTYRSTATLQRIINTYVASIAAFRVSMHKHTYIRRRTCTQMSMKYT